MQSGSPSQVHCWFIHFPPPQSYSFALQVFVGLAAALESFFSKRNSKVLHRNLSPLTVHVVKTTKLDTTKRITMGFIVTDVSFETLH